MRERAFPSLVVGPVLRLAFARFAVSCFSVAILRYFSNGVLIFDYARGPPKSFFAPDRSSPITWRLRRAFERVLSFKRTPGPLRSSSGMNSTPAFPAQFAVSRGCGGDEDTLQDTLEGIAANLHEMIAVVIRSA